MNSPTYKTWWISHYDRERAFFERDIEPFENWERVSSHGRMADRFFRNGRCVLYGNGPEVIARKFLLASISIVDRAMSEVNFQEDKYVKNSFPSNHGEALRVRAYARAC